MKHVVGSTAIVLINKSKHTTERRQYYCSITIIIILIMNEEHSLTQCRGSNNKGVCVERVGVAGGYDPST